MHSDCKSLCKRGDKLFSAKFTLDSRNQHIAENFHPMRADFTRTMDIGEDFMADLMTGYPVQVRHDLGTSFGTMLRPRGQQWFHTGLRDEGAQVSLEAKQWLEWTGGVMRRAMNDRISQFSRATSEADQDFAAFGQAVISTETNYRDVALIYRCWHLRDVAWCEDSYGQFKEVHRNWKVSASELTAYFPKTVHHKVREAVARGEDPKVVVRHVVVRSDEYGDGKYRQPWVSIYVDVENQHILEERGSWTMIYTIPRFATISGSQYGYSPATMVALPDARLLQAMTLTLLEAGEKSVNPPLVGVAEAIRGDMQMYAGGFTSVDAEYDERLGEVLRPITVDKSGLGFGLEMTDRVAGSLRNAFFLNKLSMPPVGGPEMTAFEVGQRVQEYIREALPLFEPMETDYNGALCEITFESLMRAGAFGSPDDIPEDIQGEDVTFRFESPLSELVERKKGQTFLEARAIIADAAAVDPSSAEILDFGATLRDVLDGIGVPAKWMRGEDAMEQAKEAQDAAASQSQLLGAMDQGAGIAQKLASASETFQTEGL